MSDVQVKFKRGNTATLNNTPITDGMIYFDTENKHIYMDNDETRIEYSNDMSNFMDKTIIENLVDKHDYNYLVSPQKMNNVIGDFPIEGDILSAISALKYISEAFVFKTVWQDDAHQPYYDKWIDIDDSYQFFIISFGSYETGIFNNNIDLNSWKCNDDNFNNLSKYFNIVINNTVSYCFSEDSYKKLGGDFETVKSFIIRASKDAHVEVTSLIVPGFNDDAEEMDRMAGWLASVDESIPLHITRFFPMYRVTDRPPTPLSVLRELRTVAEKHLRSVYLGNV